MLPFQLSLNLLFNQAMQASRKSIFVSTSGDYYMTVSVGVILLFLWEK